MVTKFKGLFLKRTVLKTYDVINFSIINISNYLTFLIISQNKTKYHQCLHSIRAVSYTHLDVYKRQTLIRLISLYQTNPLIQTIQIFKYIQQCIVIQRYSNNASLYRDYITTLLRFICLHSNTASFWNYIPEILCFIDLYSSSASFKDLYSSNALICRVIFQQCFAQQNYTCIPAVLSFKATHTLLFDILTTGKFLYKILFSAVQCLPSSKLHLITCLLYTSRCV